MEDIHIPKEKILDEMYDSIKGQIDDALKQVKLEAEVVDIIWTKNGLTLKLSSLT